LQALSYYYKYKGTQKLKLQMLKTRAAASPKAAAMIAFYFTIPSKHCFKTTLKATFSSCF